MKKTNDHSFLKFYISLIICGFTGFVSAQDSSEGSTPQYLFKQFVSGTVRMKNSQNQTQVLNYNTVTEKIVFIKDDKYYDLMNPEAVDTIIIEGRKFVPVGKSFYEVLYSGKIPLYIQNKISLLPPGKPAGYGGTSQSSSSEYVSSINQDGIQWNLKIPSDYTVMPRSVYWIHRGTEWLDFTNEKQLLKLFPDKAGVLKERIKSDKIKFDKPEGMVELMKIINSL
jgi:hypothetical protein